MGTKARDNFSERIISVVHKSGRSWRIATFQVDAGRLTLLDARTGEQGSGPLIEAANAKHGRGRIVRIVPGTGSVCRIGAVATGGEAETLAALALVAEAMLPTGVPPHRRAAGVLTTGAPSTESRVLATAWIGAAEPEARSGADRIASAAVAGAGESWITEAGALAGCLTEPGLAAVIDAETFTIAVLASGPERSIARQLLADGSSTDAWRASVGSVIAETAQAAGLPAAALPEVTSSGGLAMAPDARAALRARAGGVPGDDRWMEQYGLCLSAAVVACGTPTVRPLARLLAEAPKVHEPGVVRSAAWLSNPSRARTIVIAGIVLLLLGPLVFAFARNTVLKSKISTLDNNRQSREQSQRQAALYSQLELSRWPVTKLLADVSQATPIGVSAETISVSTETGLKFAGRAESQTQVNALQANLNSTKLFRNVKVGRTGSLDNGGVEFDITAEVVSPHNKVVGMEDFAAKVLAVRLYGEGADNLKEAPVSDKKPARRTGRVAEETDKESASTGSRRSTDDGPPAVLTDADIAKMDNSTAMKEWAKRRKYVQTNPSLDTENKDRINNEATKLREQMKKAQAAPATGAPKP